MGWKEARDLYKGDYAKYKKEMIECRTDEVQHLLPGFYAICEGVKIATGKRALQNVNN